MKRIYALAVASLLLATPTMAQSNKLSQRHDTCSVNQDKEEYIIDNSTAETKAAYPGGQTALLKDIFKNVVYPTKAMENEIRGTVVLNFVVEKNGSIGPIQIRKSLTQECDQAAINAVKKLKRFKPAKQQGKPVRVSFTLPIRFQFQNCQ